MEALAGLQVGAAYVPAIRVGRQAEQLVMRHAVPAGFQLPKFPLHVRGQIDSAPLAGDGSAHPRYLPAARLDTWRTHEDILPRPLEKGIESCSRDGRLEKRRGPVYLGAADGQRRTAEDPPPAEGPARRPPPSRHSASPRPRLLLRDPRPARSPA